MDDGFQSWPYKGWVWPQTGILDLATIMHAQLWISAPWPYSYAKR